MNGMYLLVGWALWGYLVWNARAGIRRDLKKVPLLRVLSVLWRFPRFQRDKGATL